LDVILLISIFMNFYQLGQNGFGNQYYAAAVRSMLDTFHNFFFVSLDPSGFVTVDKPPLGFWLQVASAKIFGFTPFSVFLPQALAGVLSVLLLYHLVRRHFGVVAGLLAALALAVSPISVVTNRNNTIDSTLVFTMLLGAWTVMKAVETGKWRWLMLTAVLVGLGFNIKMLEAYLVVPAYALLYLLAAPRSLKMRIAQLFVAALVMLTLSLSWAVVVDLTPASQRPYVGSSQDNSELSLALGYNGIQRLLGSFGFGGGNARNGSAPTSTSSSSSSSSQGAQSGTTGQPPEGFPGGNGGTPPQGSNGYGPPFQGTQGSGQQLQGSNGNSGGMFNTGTAGPFRLFNEPLGGQIVWLLPLALLGMLALAWQHRPHLRDDRQQQSLVLWGIWLLTMAVFFSAAGFFHQYYLSTLAPAICAMFGIGVVVMWNDLKRSGWRGWLLPVALLLTAAEQIHIITSNT
jgi:4-amino-4-deoxy-L-arabinose transferase-like glycosyltransferase